MESDRSLVPLGQIASDVAYGYTARATSQDTGVKFVRTTDIVREVLDWATVPYCVIGPDELQRYLLRPDDIVISRMGTIGHSALVNPPQDAVFASFLVRFRMDTLRADPQYVAYTLRSPTFWQYVRSHRTGSVQPNLNATLMRGFRLPLPALREQRAIAGILRALDDKIQLNRRVSETLERMARALFKSWFVDFEPVLAKAQGHGPGLSSSRAALFPDSLQSSELGDIPAGWSASRLEEVAEHPRRTVSSHEIESTTPYIGLEHMPRKSIALTQWAMAKGLQSGKFRHHRGDILFGKLRPYFHKVGVSPLDGVCSTDIVVVTPREERWFGFVLGHMSSDAFVAYADGGSTGTKMPRTSWDEMARYAVPLPPADIAEAFTAVIRPITECILAAIHESNTLAELRDALLPKLISGELRVPDAERIAVEAGA